MGASNGNSVLFGDARAGLNVLLNATKLTLRTIGRYIMPKII